MWIEPVWGEFVQTLLSGGAGFRYDGAMNQTRFIHLRVHTEHSLLEGAVPVKKLVKLCVEAGMPAVAVTDTNNMFAALEFSVTAMEAAVACCVVSREGVLCEVPCRGAAKPRTQRCQH